MKKVLCLICALALLLSVLAACNWFEVPGIRLDKPTVEGESVFEYDGAEKTLALSGFDPETMTVTGNKKTQPGSYICRVQIKEPEEYVWEGGGSVSFEWSIVKGTLETDDASEFAAAAAGGNYDIILTGNIVLTENVTIPQGVTVYAKGFTISGTGILTNNGTIVAEADTGARILAAIEFANEIKLVDDINESGQLVFNSAAKAYDFKLDLNGYSIRPLRFRNYTSTGDNGKDLNVVILDSSGNKGVIGKTIEDTTNPYAGIEVLSNANSKLNVTLSGVTPTGFWYGLATNGTQGVLIETGTEFRANITAVDCDFVGECLAMYLPAGFNYNFENCTFTARSAVHMKSGNVTFDNCVFEAAGVWVGRDTNYDTYGYEPPLYYNNGVNTTGNALMLECSPGYKQFLDVTIIGGTFYSAYGYAVEVAGTSSGGGTHTIYATLDISGNPEYDCPENIGSELFPAN